MTQNSEENRIRLQQTARWLIADTQTPISLFLEVVGEGVGILLESAEVDGRWGRYSILACDMRFFINCLDGKLHLDILDERFQPLEQYEGLPFVEGMRKLMSALEIAAPANVAHLPPITRALYGYMGFGMAAIFNKTLRDALPVAAARCSLALPGAIYVFDHLYNRLCQICLGEPKGIGFSNISAEPNKKAIMDEEEDYGGSRISSEPDEEGYKNFVRDICGRLRRGEAIQIVPSVRFSMPFAGNPFTLYRRMRRHNASPYMFFMKFPAITLFGSSPEVMVRCSENHLQLSPIAGTRPRGKTDREDAELAKELLADPKERAEHVMLVDLGRNDLGRIARPGAVKLDRFMEVEKFSHVMHLTSRVIAELGENEDGRPLDALDVLAATFPAGTVSGAPKLRAMEIIGELEKNSRGPYAGCIGWIGLDRNSVNMDMGITIRSMWLQDGRLYWQAGGGIVHDSDPDEEWKEVCNKSAIMRLSLLPENEDYVPADR